MGGLISETNGVVFVYIKNITQIKKRIEQIIKYASNIIGTQKCPRLQN